jgi:hypothetical protein
VSTDDDDLTAAYHQLELENRQFEEEWQKEYNAWLTLQAAWWVYIDNDPNWIKEHEYA